MASPSKNRIGCWFSALLERKRGQNASLTAQFGANAQAALDAPEVSAPASKRGSLTRDGLTLADLLPGECGYISCLVGTTQGRLRLLEMGMTPGTHVQVTRIAAFGGPLDVQVRGYQLSLRRDEAAAVWLGSLPDAGAGVDSEEATGKDFDFEADEEENELADLEEAGKTAIGKVTAVAQKQDSLG